MFNQFVSNFQQMDEKDEKADDYIAAGILTAVMASQTDLRVVNKAVTKVRRYILANKIELNGQQQAVLAAFSNTGNALSQAQNIIEGGAPAPVLTPSQPATSPANQTDGTVVDQPQPLQGSGGQGGLLQNPDNFVLQPPDTSGGSTGTSRDFSIN